MISRLLLPALAVLLASLVSCESTGSVASAAETRATRVSAPEKKSVDRKPGAGATHREAVAKSKELASSSTRVSGRRAVLRTTAYHCREADHLVYGSKSAYGTPLRYGRVRSAAADWSRFPVGTVFRIKGLPHMFIIDDYGSALVGKNTLDLYTRSKREMDWWGARHVEVEFLRWGSYELSYKILAERSKYPHCAQMASAIRARRPHVARSAAGRVPRS